MAIRRAVRPLSHGGAPAGWLDLSANPNPLGTPRAVRAAIGAARYDRYADLDTRAAERHLAADAGVARAAVLLTAGATEALRLVATALLGPDDRAVIVGPTYGEYARLGALAGAAVEEIRAVPPSFDPPLEALVRALDAPARVVVVGDPNNPTGRALGPAGYRRLLDGLRAGWRRSALLVVDESFAPFAAEGPPDPELLATGRVLLLRSLTKRLAVPGVRVGYVIGPPRILARLSAARDPWPVGAHAIAAARAARWRLAPDERVQIADWRRALADGLNARGLCPTPSDANFVLAEAGPVAPELVARLARRRIAVRDATSFGLPGYLRVAVRPPGEQERLFAALDAFRAAREAGPRP